MKNMARIVIRLDSSQKQTYAVGFTGMDLKLKSVSYITNC